MIYTFSWVDPDEQTTLCRRDQDGNVLYIPTDIQNPYYQHYLDWISEGNTLDSADEPPSE
jgi:hypothetical protein